VFHNRPEMLEAAAGSSLSSAPAPAAAAAAAAAKAVKFSKPQLHELMLRVKHLDAHDVCSAIREMFEGLQVH
jgi:hypothetical protein